MRPIYVAAAFAVLAAASAAHGGIVWEANFEKGLGRAAQEGRPVLLAVNALEGEGANERLCHQAYPSERWGSAAQGYICFICNAGTHGSTGNTPSCKRYGGIPCKSHQDAWRYVVRRFSPIEKSLISPQHVILEPDGGVAFRKEYYTGVVKPELLERLFVQLSPELTYEIAGDERAERIEALENTELDSLRDTARTWLRSGDLYAAASVLRAIDFSFDDERRLRLTQALDATPPTQLSVLGLFADEAGARPDDRPEEVLAFARALQEVDRKAGVRLLARIACHTRDPKLREKALTLWLEGGEGAARRPRDLPLEERAAWAEMQLLTEKQAGVELDSDALPESVQRRFARAEVEAGLRKRRFPPLGEALEGASSSDLRGALLEASPKEVRSNTGAVRALLRARPPVPRLRVAAALALLEARVAAEGLVPLYVWAGVQDPLEGKKNRAEAVERLGADPGWEAEAWQTAVTQALLRSPR